MQLGQLQKNIEPNRTMNDTPRTDAEWQHFSGYLKPLQDAKNLSEQLERELNAVTEQRDQWKAKYIQQNKDLGCEMMDPNGTIWDHAKKVQLELIAMTEQRDEAREYADRLAEGLPEGLLPKDVEVLREANLGLATELAAVTAQRDRLQKIVDEQCRFSSVCREYREQRDKLAKAIITHRAKAFLLTGEDFNQELWQALQSLTPNDPDPHRFCRAGEGNIIHCVCKYDS